MSLQRGEGNARREREIIRIAHEADEGGKEEEERRCEKGKKKTKIKRSEGAQELATRMIEFSVRISDQREAEWT